eukprot:1291626-Amphidinium_carterae.1
MTKEIDEVVLGSADQKPAHPLTSEGGVLIEKSAGGRSPVREAAETHQRIKNQLQKKKEPTQQRVDRNLTEQRGRLLEEAKRSLARHGERDGQGHGRKRCVDATTAIGAE